MVTIRSLLDIVVCGEFALLNKGFLSILFAANLLFINGICSKVSPLFTFVYEVSKAKQEEKILLNYLQNYIFQYEHHNSIPVKLSIDIDHISSSQISLNKNVEDMLQEEDCTVY